MRTDPLIGQHIDDFTVLERIGRGGMASVYRARQHSVEREVALKVLHLDDEHIGDDFRRRFEHEARLIATLEHIHILPVYSYGIKDNFVYLSMRLLRGGSLADQIHAGPIPLDRCVDLFSQIARGLAYAHVKGVIHRDLKPSNILLDDDGNAMLTDFGLARLIEGDTHITKTGNIVGTPAYMSPEQLRGDPLDLRSDLYSLGVVLYQMLVGRLPFEGVSSDVIGMIYKHLEKQPDPPSQINPMISPEVERVVLRALEKERDARFSSTGQMANALRMAAGYSSTADFLALPTPPDLTPQPMNRRSTPQQAAAESLPTRRNRRWLLGGMAAVGVLAVVVIALALQSNGNTGNDRPLPVINAGVEMRFDELEPSADEVRTAAAWLGDDGFVALLACNRSSEYHAGIAREINDLMVGYALPLEIYDADNDQGRQITQVEQARADGAKGFILCPLDIALLAAQLRSLDEADLPLVLFSRGSETNYGGVAMAGSSYQLGLPPGRYAGEIVRDEMNGQARVVILDFPDLPSIVERADAMEAGLLEIAPEAEVIGRYIGGTRENGRDSIAGLLEADVEFDLILSINDAGAYGAIDALEAADITPDEVAIVSVDAEALAVEYIREGRYIRGSMPVGREETARGMVYAMVKLLAGGEVPELIRAEPPTDGIVTRESLEGE
jgi:serine/threonine-protein kinase